MSWPDRSHKGRAPWIGGLAVIAAALTGCNEPTGSPDTTETDEEVVASSAQALQPATCVTVKRGGPGNIHDAFLSGDYPYWATGGDYEMYLGLSSGGNENKVLVSFDLDFLPPYAIVTNATFSLFLSWPPDDATVRAHEVLVPWDEATVKTANFPPNGYDSAVAGSFQTGSLGYRYMDITPLVAAWVNGSKANNGMLLEEGQEYWHSGYLSESGASVRPALLVCYVNGPAPHKGGALVSGGVTSDSESYRFIGSMGEGPGQNRVSSSENHRFFGGLVGATQE